MSKIKAENADQVPAVETETTIDDDYWLTDDERAAIAEVDAKAAETEETPAAETVAETDPEPKAEETAETVAAETQAEEAETKPEETAATATTSGPEEIDIPDQSVPDVAPLQTKLKEVRTELRGLRTKYDEGEITSDEYDAKTEALEDTRDQLNRQIASVETRTQLIAESNQAVIVGISAEAKKIGIDYSNPVLAVAYDKALETHAAAGLGFKAAARKAHADIMALMGKTAGKTEPKAEAKTEETTEVKPAPKRDKPDLSVVPKTLSRLPNASSPTAESDAVARFDRMSPAEQEAWMETANEAQIKLVMNR